VIIVLTTNHNCIYATVRSLQNGKSSDHNISTFCIDRIIKIILVEQNPASPSIIPFTKKVIAGMSMKDKPVSLVFHVNFNNGFPKQEHKMPMF